MKNVTMIMLSEKNIDYKVVSAEMILKIQHT